jgi:hypothetical protein
MALGGGAGGTKSISSVILMSLSLPASCSNFDDYGKFTPDRHISYIVHVQLKIIKCSNNYMVVCRPMLGAGKLLPNASWHDR